MNETQTMTREELLAAQKEICDKMNWPHFAPTDGICFMCRRDCVNAKWAVEPITSCSKCGKAFND